MAVSDLGVILFTTALLCYLLGGLAAVIFSSNQKAANLLAHVSALMGGVFGAAAALRVLATEEPVTLTVWEIAKNVPFTFQVDSLSAFFLLIISLLTAAVSVYSIGYVTEYYPRKTIGWLGGLLNFFVLSMVAVVTVQSAFVFLLAWEVMSLISFLLVMYEHEKNDVRTAGYVYVVMTHLGTVFIVISFLLLFLFTNSLDFAVFAERGTGLPASLKNLIFLLCFIGFGTKAGMVPLHVWLPRAHPAAPSHISALMSAVMIKTAIYGLIRVTYDFLGGGPWWWGVVVIGLGLLSAFLGILLGLAQNDMKRFLAYSSAENMGIILVGLGASLLLYSQHYPLLGALALTAALYHILNHAVFKGLLFMGAGSVLFSAHTKNINELGGLIHRMPWTALFFLIGGASLAALPPLGGFISEWATLQVLLHLSFDMNDWWLKLAGCIGAAVLGLSGAFAAGGVIKHFGTAFLAMPRSLHAEQAREVPVSMRLGMGVLALATILLGLWPGLVLNITNSISKQYFAQQIAGNALLYIPFAGQSGEMLSVSAPFAVFLGLLVLCLLLLRYKFGSSQYRIDETWNCGTTLIPGMAYTGTAYSHPVLVIFRKVTGMVRKVDTDQEYLYYPKRIRHSLSSRYNIESTLYKPLVRLTVVISQRIRTIQNGNLQSYLAYMVVTLIIALLSIR